MMKLQDSFFLAQLNALLKVLNNVSSLKHALKEGKNILMLVLLFISQASKSFDSLIVHQRWGSQD